MPEKAAANVKTLPSGHPDPYAERRAELRKLTADELRARVYEAEGNIETNLVGDEMKRRGMDQYAAKRPRRRPAPASQPNRRPLPDLPDGYMPGASDEWTEHDENFLEAVLRLRHDYEDFDPKHPRHNRPDPRKAWPRNQWIFLREEAGLTQKGLGEQIGVDQPSISRWENGTRHPDNEAYLAFLRATADELAMRTGYTILRMAGIRDGWGDIGLDEGAFDVVLYHLHPAIFKEGGTYDRWKEVGSLAAWTPRDAGLSRV